MRCPICGAKMKLKQICPYCKVTNEQVLQASNSKVKEYRKKGYKDLIYLTNVIPNDVSRLKLILYTIFFGLIGVNHYYVNRIHRANFSLCTTCSCFVIFVMYLLIDFKTEFGENLFGLIYQIIFYCMAINVVLWILNIFGSIFKTFKVPVVMPEKE